jgi:hypothetical protein
MLGTDRRSMVGSIGPVSRRVRVSGERGGAAV